MSSAHITFQDLFAYGYVHSRGILEYKKCHQINFLVSICFKRNSIFRIFHHSRCKSVPNLCKQSTIAPQKVSLCNHYRLMLSSQHEKAMKVLRNSHFGQKTNCTCDENELDCIWVIIYRNIHLRPLLLQFFQYFGGMKTKNGIVYIII